jgi:RNA polymerase sigma factor (sigma-70 family)
MTSAIESVKRAAACGALREIRQPAARPGLRATLSGEGSGVTGLALRRLYGVAMAAPSGLVLDADALSRLYDAHAQTMLGWFVRRIYDPEAAMDLVAETFAVAFAGRRRFVGDGDDAALAWLYGIARHRLADFSRRSRREYRALRRLGFQRRPVTGEEYERIEDLAGLGELREGITDALATLSAEQRTALQLRVVEDRPYSQVAAALGVSEQTARARVSRALAALRATPAAQTLIESHEPAI